MKPQSIITVRFVKRLLLGFVGGFVLLMMFPSLSKVFEYVLFPIALLTIVVLQLLFPTTQITVDDETICFTRKFQDWNPLKKYYLHELIIPHSDWDSWIKISISTNNTHKNYYLFFKDDSLNFIAETRKSGDLEYWIEKKFPDRILQTKYSFRRYRDRYDTLKEKKPMRVF